MTVRELIEELEKHPPDMEVCTQDGDYTRIDIKNIEEVLVNRRLSYPNLYETCYDKTDVESFTILSVG